ncbi:putative RNA methyltransferase [Cucurbita argyrosperma subsp. argyrosperma]|nr:putative RNA methyltransferase [Cucurbita argyrosperma subsp. argyrosperma]
MAEEQEKAEAELKQNPKRRKKHAFPYGNYQSYYGYRLGQKFVEDPRLKVFKKEWFEGKDCLDIGCNSGMVTIQIARKFNCRRILGVDIDPDLNSLECLSVAKWIHLNWGDDGLITLFYKIWRLLHPIGFRTVEALTTGLSHSNTGGFNRPIFVFQK